jgi:hypothetical protein
MDNILHVISLNDQQSSSGSMHLHNRQTFVINMVQ